MGINDIELPSFALAGLYSSTLIGENDPKPGAHSTAPAPSNSATKDGTSNPLKWLGNNEQMVLIVVKSSAATYLPDQQLSFLTGILTACRLSIADVAILNTHQHEGISYKEIISRLNSKNILLFGIGPAEWGLPINFPAYQLQQFNGATYLAAPALPELEDDKIQKSKLWVALKNMFNI